MFTIQLSRSAFQSVACLLLAVIIVSGSLTIGAVGVIRSSNRRSLQLAKNA